LDWKKCRVVASIAALEQEISELNKYIEDGESVEDKEDNEKINKIMNGIMPLMTHMWFKDINL